MNDPWDVKSVRQSGQYISCMKISGVPLLPPVLSKECRKEMQYYKLLAKEVEKRIALLQPYVFDSCSSSDNEDPTEAPELPECEQNYELSQEETQSDFDINIDKIRNVSPPLRTNETYIENKGSPKSPTSKFFIDVNQNINESPKDTKNSSPRSRSPPSRVRSPPLRDLPERDYNCVKRVTQKVITEKQIITEVETKRNVKRKSRISEDNFAFNEPVSDPFSGIPLPQDGPSSLSSKSFTGSLNDLHSESIKDSDVGSGKLLRQRSYTLLKPSPQLLAHLEVHSQNTGVEMTSISMSESLSNISSPSKKRRSWDLESAKVKWSTMALELKQKNVVNVISKSSVGKNVVRPTGKNLNLQRAKSVTPNTAKRNNINHKPLSKSEPIPNTRKSISPVRNKVNNRSVKTEPVAPRVNEKGGASTKVLATPISESADPAARVRELYEKIQKQQLAQMASLVEKQKREQMLLQQVFEEQNNLLFKQLKTICPKSPIEAKEAWGDQILCEGDRGPVSLSQVINYKSPDQSAFSSPVSTTLNDTSNYINHCDNVLKKSRDITGSLKKPQIKSHSQNGTKIQSPRTEPDGSRTRTHSPARKAATSRRLNYDSSASTDRDYDQILTDRTNDTLADLNVTFPSDHSEEGNGSVIHNKNIVSHLCGKETKTNHGHSGQSNPSIQSRSTENAIKNLERNISSSMNSVSTRSSKPPVFKNPPTSKERAAATKIVAHVKGYLVRRLMRTDRVQGIVQTIKDALLCALQLHQDREGIRGADVDLHRRLIQQITAACYSLHDTFVASTPAERCAMIAADRGKRRRSLASRSNNNSFKQTDIMSQSHTGSFPARAKSRQPPSLMTQSNYETFSGDKSSPVSRRYMSSPRRRPWR